MGNFARHLGAHWAAGFAAWCIIATAALLGTDEPWIFRYVPVVAAILASVPILFTVLALRAEPLKPTLLRVHAGLIAGGVLGALIDQSPLTALLTGIYGYWAGVAWADFHGARQHPIRATPLPTWQRLIQGAVKIVAAAFVLLLAGSTLAYAAFTGPRGGTDYPAAAESPYRLPWPAGTTRFCIQGNRAVVSHRGWEEHAFDFTMPVGSPVCAARAGEVTQVIVENDGHGYKWPNNKVVVRHEDGTLANYLHLKRNGSKVQVGDRVTQGQVIAESGHVGNSMLPHLHFHVTDAERKRTLPITFADVHVDDGIPRMFKYYTAGEPAP